MRHRTVRNAWGCALTYCIVGGAYLLFRCWGGRVLGRRHLSTFVHDGGILVANHTSYMDWLVLSGVFRFEYGFWPVFLAKDRLFRHRLFGPMMEFGKCIRVDDEGKQIIADADLQGVKCLVIFPEGKRSLDGMLGKGHTGAARHAAMLGKAIFPVGLKGFFEVWPSHRKLPRPGRCEIVCGAPRHVALDLQADLDQGRLETEAGAIMREIAALAGSA